VTGHQLDPGRILPLVSAVCIDGMQIGCSKDILSIAEAIPLALGVTHADLEPLGAVAAEALTGPIVLLCRYLNAR
jgi:hypothetical protein